MDGAGAKDGVSLDKLHRDRKFIIAHLLDPEANVAKNPGAFKGDPNLMPSHQLSNSEAASIADYLLATKPIDAGAASTSEQKQKPAAQAGLTGTAANGQQLYRKLNCAVCHSVNQAGGCMGPPLGGVTKRRSNEYLKLRLGAGEEEKFIALIGHPELFPHPRFDKEAVSSLVAYLRSLEAQTITAPASHKLTKTVSQKPPANPVQTSEDAPGARSNPEGRRLFTQMGCLSCHSVGKTGGSVAPSLDGIGRRRTREYVEAHISNPDAHFQKEFSGKRKSKMGSTGLFPEEVRSITEFVLSLPPSKGKASGEM
jgi:mono/diheme cytochrome c family protein